MTDAQIIAIAITVLAVMVGSVFNNVRISEVSASMNRRIDGLKDVLRSEFRADMTGIRAGMSKMEPKLDTLISMVGHIDTRVTKLEVRTH